VYSAARARDLPHRWVRSRPCAQLWRPTVVRLWTFGTYSKTRAPFEEISQVRIEFVPGYYDGETASRDTWEVAIATAPARGRTGALYGSANTGEVTRLAKRIAAAAGVELVDIRR
jgi:hypothetical protein